VRISPKTSKLSFVRVIAFSDDAARGRALALGAGVSVREDLVQQDLLRDAGEELLP
jgi:hypothetical protein